MTTGPNWQTMLEKSAPDLMKHVGEMQKNAQTDGALSAKTKVLMMMLCDSLLGHNEGVANLANRARSLGASEAEVVETVGMAFLMGGLPGLVTGANAFKR